MFIRNDISRTQAYLDIALTYKNCPDASKQMSKETALILKAAIDKFFKCSKAREYKNKLYDALMASGMIPINPTTKKLFTLHDTQNYKAVRNNADIELVRSIGSFYQQLHRFHDGYEPPTQYSLTSLSSLKSIAPQDPNWFQMVSELELYAKENNIFG